MKFAFFTLGCKVNLFETQALSQLAEARGHEIVDKDADAVIVNTCTVTSVSDHKNIRAFHKLRRDNPNAVIAACGCFAQTDPERVRATGEIDLICGTRDRAQVIDLCEQAVSGQAVQVHESEDSGFETLPAGIPHGRTRALLKIEDGCNNFCTYCIIPYARGRVRSLPVEQAIEQTARLADAGVHEIVLTGIEIASYGKDFEPQVPLTELLEKLLTAQPNVQFRLGSLDPRAVDDAFCERLAGFANLARHFHLSMQSGCDTVLRRMNRHYTADEYRTIVRNLRAAFENAAAFRARPRTSLHRRWPFWRDARSRPCMYSRILCARAQRRPPCRVSSISRPKPSAPSGQSRWQKRSALPIESSLSAARCTRCLSTRPAAYGRRTDATAFLYI